MRFGPDDATPRLTVLNLGAGVQSSTVLLMACEGEIPSPDLAIFADTQWEPAAVYDWLEWLEKQAAAADIPLERVTAGDLRGDVLAAVKDNNDRDDEAQAGSVGQPPLYVRGKLDEGKREGRLWRKCSTDYKITPIRRRIRELLGAGHGERVAAGVYAEQWFGISLDEVQRMRTPRDPWAINYYPLVDLRMRRAGCLEWMRDHGYPDPPRSACIGCPFHSDDEWRRLRDQTPEEWGDAVAFDAAVREGLPGVKGPAFLHRSTVPLDEVDLSTPEDDGQGRLWGNECEGVCGV